MTPVSTTKHTHSRSHKLEGGNETLVAELLHKDHLKVSDLFFQYDQLEEDKEKQMLVERILNELFVHAKIEEEVVYPMIRKEGGDDKETDDLMDEAETEHHVAKTLMLELTTMKPSDEFYDAKVCVLGEAVRHHVREEEKYMFPKMKGSEMDLERLAQKCMARKEELITITTEEITDALNQELYEDKKRSTNNKRK